MAKVQKIFACSSCGNTSPKWAGKCDACGEWNTLQEEIIFKETAQEEKKKAWKPDSGKATDPKPVMVQDIKTSDRPRLITPDNELNRVLGGGIVAGSIILIGGQPGIGKSTLMLQVALNAGARVLYVSGEESEEQIKMRADRVSNRTSECYILTETNVSKILQQAQQLEPDVMIIDSIQTLSSPNIDSTPGSISQVRECAGDLQRFAKESNIPVFVIGHISVFASCI